MEAAITDPPKITTGDPASSFTGSTNVRMFFETPAEVARQTIRAKSRLANLMNLPTDKLTAFAQPMFRQVETSAGAQPVFRSVETSAGVFDAIRSFYLSTNHPRDRQIAERITILHRLALEEREEILPASLAQFTRFFLHHANHHLVMPKITLTPDGTLRARWIHGPEDFVAIEFTGNPLVKLVAEVPRRQEGQTASHFASEPIESVVSISRAIGASFG
jgi:hypothetical protein